MADSTNHTRSLNPWLLHLQKLGLELKCPLCLKFFDRPMLLPCNHIFCNSCIPKTTQFRLECPICKAQHSDRDLRPVPHMENMVTIYRSLDVTFCASLLSPDAGKVSGQCPTLVNNLDYKLKKEAVEASQDCGPQEIDMNQVAQSSPSSPPSFGDIKGLEDDSSDHGSEHSLDKCSAKRPVEKNSDNNTGQERNDNPASGTKEDIVRDLKRQKNLNYGAQQSSISDSSDGNKTFCAFCQSSKLTEATGSLLHYANGKQVVGDYSSHSKVIHVHRKCIEWAPQVYYVGETVKNLEQELARGAKLKCSSCGLKGAALGCYAKSCRKSFHVPCAVEVLGCRWDCENFLVLCPSHSSLKFPNENFKSEKQALENHPMPSQITPQQSNFWAASPNRAKEWVLCGSAVSGEEKFLLIKFASMSGVTVSKFWKPNVTHVIASTDENGACSRTLKVLMAIVNGRWVLNIDWIKACMKAMHPVDEEPYEVSLDNHGCLDGPKTGRLRTLDNAPKLFNGLNFYFSGDFVPAYKEDLQKLVTAAGGTVLKSKDKLVAQVHDALATTSALVVYNLDSPLGCKLGEEVSVLWQRLEEAEALAAEIRSQVIGHTWLLESIAACKLRPFATR